MENIREQYEPVVTFPGDQQEIDEGDQQEIEDRRAPYVYAFLLSSSDRELDVTVREDGSVSVVASCNERAGRELAGTAGAVVPPVQLSSTLSLPDDADTSAVKIHMDERHLNITFARAEMMRIPNRKLTVQAD